jgi:hypothetical protein
MQLKLSSTRILTLAFGYGKYQFGVEILYSQTPYCKNSESSIENLEQSLSGKLLLAALYVKYLF